MFDGQQAKSWSLGRGGQTSVNGGRAILGEVRKRAGRVNRPPSEAAEFGRCWMESSDEVRRPTNEVVEPGGEMARSVRDRAESFGVVRHAGIGSSSPGSGGRVAKPLGRVFGRCPAAERHGGQRRGEAGRATQSG